MTATHTSIARRRLLRAGAAGLAAFGILKSGQAQARVLRVGDMNSIAIRPVLEAAGLLKDLPYEVQWSKYPAGAPELEALNAGAIDFGQVGDIAVLFAYASQVPVRVVHTIRFKANQMVLLVGKNSSARSITDLKGRKIAVNRGGGGHLLTLALLERAGLKADDVKLHFLGPADAKPAFANGAVDAWAVWPPYSTLAIEQDGARQIANLNDTPGVYTADEFHIVHRDALVHKRPLVEDFNRRLVQARQWSLNHVDETAALIARDTKLPVALARQVRADIAPTPYPVSDQSISGLQAAADLLARHGVIAPLKVDGLFDRSVL
ncbi:MAG: aliphatic sulfonate ABC transporter substrate-binding protein [Xenophilus sp.]